MNKIPYLLVAFTGILFLISCGAEKKDPSEKPDGKNLYQMNCGRCHGEDGKLGNSGAKDLSASTMEKDEIYSIIKYGKKLMPPLEGVLNDSEIDAVSDYVLTLKK